MIVGLIVAAGLSTRFPGNKLLFRWEGKPVIRWSIENVVASDLDRVVVVIGYMADKIREALKDLDVEYVYNEEYATGGMSSSVRRGVEYIYKKYGGRLEAFTVSPGDAAWIPPEAYNAVIEAYREYRGRKLIVVAAYKGRRGHPILFDARLVPEILSIDEASRGLKKITRKYYWDTLVVELPYPGIILDLDTYNDLNRVKRTLFK